MSESKKRALTEISNSFTKEAEYSLAHKKIKENQEFPELKTFSTFSNSEVIDMLNKLGFEEKELNCLKHSVITGEFLGQLITSGDVEQTTNVVKMMLSLYDDNARLVWTRVIDYLSLRYVPKKNASWTDKINTVDISTDGWLESMYENTLEYTLKSNHEQTATKKDLEEVIDSIFREQIGYSTLPLQSHESFVQQLPIRNNKLAKHYLPFIPSLHIESNNDTMLNQMVQKTVTIMSPSGIGKTSLMIRSLCKSPGILITGTSFSEGDSGQTTDEAVRTLIGYLLKPKIEVFSYVRQSVQILMISKLLYILHLIELAKKDETLLNPFEGNLFSFLAFNQFNGSNKTIQKIFVTIFAKCKYYKDCHELRRITEDLIKEVKTRTKSEKFLVCVDEANVIEEQTPKQFYSVNGNQRGALTVFVSEILHVNREGLNIYAGTSFSIDIDEIVQSIEGKTEASLITTTLSEFEYLDFSSFSKYLLKHINVSQNLSENIGKKNFPIRIRQAALCLEFYIDERLVGKNETLENCFHKSSETLIKSLQVLSIQENYFFETVYKTHLLQYIVHHKYASNFGSSFHVPERHIAAHLLKSGIACPIASTLSGKVEFKALDVIGYKFAKKFLQIQSSVSKFSKMELAIFIAENTDNRQRFEISYSIALSAVKGKIEDILTLNSTINKPLNDLLKQIEFKCNIVLSSTGFYEYSLRNNWIDGANTKTGEQLYFEFAVKDPGRIANILFRPSDEAHDDAIIALMANDSKLVFMRISYKCLTGERKQKQNGYKSTLPELMFLNGYKNCSLQELESYVDSKTHIKGKEVLQISLKQDHWWNEQRANFLDLYRNRSLSVIIHPKIGEEKKNVNRKSYHNAVFITTLGDAKKLFGEVFSECISFFLKRMEKLDKEKQSSTSSKPATNH